VEPSEQRFGDKVALITGAGSGIGRLTAQRFAREGARVGCSDINAESLGETVSSIEKAGGQALALPCDVADPEAARSAVDRCADELGGLDVVANVAGMGSMRHTAEVTALEWNRVLGVNLNGTFFISQAALPHLLARRRSAIVNVSSLAGLIGQAYCAAYCASKAAVVSLTKVFAVEFAKQGLRANCICPAGVATPLISSFAAPENADPAMLSRLGLLPKLTRPEEVAEAIVYLASPAARSISGVSLPMDFGTSAA
jgi:meso-butanediol dehydrogenase/(S,S)-butanediol dehydrogenase/diacetyl reductase